MPLTVGSLFSGIGGIDLGLERAGMVLRWQVEIDPWCRRVLAKHWPDVRRYDDVRTVGAELEPVDVVAGGFPCQPFSSAGKRLGTADDRWLWPELARSIRHLRPRYVLVENVPGFLVRGMSDVLGELASLGFDAEWNCLPAAAVGAPHIRDRVFIVAYPGSGRHGLAPEAVSAGWASPQLHGWWASQPDVCRVADGIPGRVDRLRGLGNAVVPQVAEYIGRLIVAAEKAAA